MNKKKIISGLLSLSLVFSMVFVNSVMAENESLLGDINGDGVITSSDYSTILRYFTGQNMEKGISFVNSDMNKDGKVNISDIILLKQLFLSEEPSVSMTTTVETTTVPTQITTEATTTTLRYTADISDLERQVAKLINEQRKQQKYGSLELDEALCLCADIRAEELLQLYDAYRPDGSHYRTLLNEYGLYGDFYQYCGEGITSSSNMARNFNQLVTIRIESGMDFSGYKKIGVGVSNGYGVVFLAE